MKDENFRVTKLLLFLVFTLMLSSLVMGASWGSNTCSKVLSNLGHTSAYAGDCSLNDYDETDNNYLRMRQQLIDDGELTSIFFAGQEVYVNSIHVIKWEQLLTDIENCAGSEGYPITVGDSFCCRVIDSNGNNKYDAGENSLSNHAGGNAIDINIDKNQYYRGGGCRQDQCDIPSCMVKAIQRHGFSWGGAYNNKCDAQHIEWTGGISNIDSSHYDICSDIGFGSVAGVTRGSGFASSCTNPDHSDSDWLYFCESPTTYKVCKKEGGSLSPIDTVLELSEVFTNTHNHPLIEKCANSGKHGSSTSSLSISKNSEGGKEIDKVWLELRAKLQAKGGSPPTGCYDPGTLSFVDCNKLNPPEVSRGVGGVSGSSTDETIGALIQRGEALGSQVDGLYDASKKGFYHYVNELNDLNLDDLSKIPPYVWQELKTSIFGGTFCGYLSGRQSHNLVTDDRREEFCKKTIDSGKFRYSIQPPNRQVNKVVLHYTVGSSVDGAFNTWVSGLYSGTSDEISASAHYIIARNGDIIYVVDEGDKAFHAKGGNTNTIGIELVNLGPTCAGSCISNSIPHTYNDRPGSNNLNTEKNYQKYTTKQMESLIELSKGIKKRHEAVKFVGHIEIEDDINSRKSSQDRKVDPGPAFPWDYFNCEIEAKSSCNDDKKFIS